MAAHIYRPPDAVAGLLGAVDAELPERLAQALGEAATPQIAYPLSKLALMAHVRRQARAWGARGARIVSLSPGLIASPQGALEFQNSPGKLKLFEQSPLGREGTLLEIADAIEFLASDRASFISGTDLLVDGGLAAALTSD
jgi:NAD(P)-dependent dehydrogenase (short-subunit alcohol dehydrogenase family)